MYLYAEIPEFETIDLGDKRLNKRAALLAEQLVDSPSASIPKACQGWKETQAAYRLISNDAVSAEAIAEPHIACTQLRMAAQSVASCIQDTSVLDFNGQAIDAPGPLQYEAQRGMFLHPTYVVTPNREPLGTIDSWRQLMMGELKVTVLTGRQIGYSFILNVASAKTASNA